MSASTNDGPTWDGRGVLRDRCIALLTGVRAVIQRIKEGRSVRPAVADRKALVIGAGDAGEQLIREVLRNPSLSYEVVGILDDDDDKQQLRLHGIPVIGKVEDAGRFCKTRDIQELLIAIPSASPEERRDIIRACRSCPVPVKSVPSSGDLLAGDALERLHEAEPEDLIGYKPVRVETHRLVEELRGRRILITGAGGAIGSELARQILPFEPDRLVLLDRNENALQQVQLELSERYPDLRIEPVVGDILDRRLLEDVMNSHLPDVVYHAAAYKHVDLMEKQPLQAIENNVFGTEMVANTAIEAGARKFVLVSTDKAVGPAGIMGMTKRMAENILLSLRERRTTFASVRFGDLGNNGGELPIFQPQIADGGPLADAGATPYFMLIAEAVQLVLQAGAMARDGEVFSLDMGEAQRILGPAGNIAGLSGPGPNEDAPVTPTGLEDGALNEELVTASQRLLLSDHENIYMAHDGEFDAPGFRDELDQLRDHVMDRDTASATVQLKAMATR